MLCKIHAHRFLAAAAALLLLLSIGCGSPENVSSDSEVTDEVAAEIKADDEAIDEEEGEG